MTKLVTLLAAAMPFAMAVEAGEAEPEVKVSRDVVPARFREKYASGNGTCGDVIASEITAMSKESGTVAILSIKKENGIPEGKWASQNVGMQRMNLSNVLRARFMKGEPIWIGGREFNLRTSLDEFMGETSVDKFLYDDAKEVSNFLRFIDMQDIDRNHVAVKRVFGPDPRAEKEAERNRKKEEKAKAAAEAKAAKEAKAAEAAKVKEAKAAEAAKAKEEKAKAAAEAKAAKAAEAAKAKAEKSAKPAKPDKAEKVAA